MRKIFTTALLAAATASASRLATHDASQDESEFDTIFHVDVNGENVNLSLGGAGS